VPTPRDPADRGSIDPATEWVLGGDPPAAVVDEYYEKYVTALAGATSTQFTCFTSTKVQILALHVLSKGFSTRKKVLSLLALLVQTYKY
jgi:hypothetical protein